MAKELEFQPQHQSPNEGSGFISMSVDATVCTVSKPMCTHSQQPIAGYRQRLPADPLNLLITKGLHPWGFRGGSDGKEGACNAGDVGSIPGSGRSPGEGKGYSLQYSCLENPMDRGAWRAVV